MIGFSEAGSTPLAGSPQLKFHKFLHVIKKIAYLLLLISAPGCSQNLWTKQDLLRPKNPNFSIQKEPFKSNSLINNKYMYISTSHPVNQAANYMVNMYGFYDDGRLILNSFNESNIDSLIPGRNSWDSAARIGYYSTKDNIVTCQYFEQYGGGEYINMEGVIKPDTIIISDKFRYLPWKITIRYDTLIRSTYHLQ